MYIQITFQRKRSNKDSVLAKGFTAASRKMQISSNELSPLVSGKAKMYTNESYYIMPYNSRTEVVRLLAERYDTKSSVKLDGFRSQLQVTYESLKSCDTTKQSFCEWQYIYIYIYIYIFGKLVTVVEGEQKSPFSIATTPRCSGGSYSFPRIVPLYPWCLPYIAAC